MKSNFFTGRLCALVLLCSVLTSVFCGCTEENMVSDASKTRVALTVWGTSEEQRMLKEMVESFRRQEEGVLYDIEVRTVEDEAAADEALRDPSSAADVFTVSAAQLEKLAGRSALVANNELTDEERESYYDGVLQSATVGGSVYGYPYAAETCILFYDRSKLDPNDLSTLDDILEKDMGQADRIGVDLMDGESYAVFFLTAGYDEKHSSEANREAMERAGEFVARLKDRGVRNTDSTSAAAKFRDGTLGAYIASSRDAAMFMEALGERFGAAPLPAMDLGSGEKQAVSYAESRMFVVNAGSKYPDEAAKLASWLSSSENQLERSEKTGSVPGKKVFSSREQHGGKMTAEAVYAQLRNTAAKPSDSIIDVIKDSLSEFAGDLFDGKIGVEDMRSKLGEMMERMTE